MQGNLRGLLAGLIASVSLVQPAAALAADGEAAAGNNLIAESAPLKSTITESNDIDTLTNQIAQKQLELIRLNTNFRFNQLQKPWQNRLWFFANLTNISLTATGALINGCGRYSYLHKNRIKKAPRDLFEHAGWLRVIANSQMVGVALLESTVLMAKAERDRKRDMDLPTLHRYAVSMQKDMDALLAKREALVNSAALSESERAAAKAEGEVLRDVRNLAVNEFVRYYADARGGAMINYMGYMLAATSNAIAGAGGIVGIHASQLNHASARYKTRLGGTGGITDIIAGAINQSVPFDLRYAGRFVYNRTWRKMAVEMDCAEPGALDKLHDHVKSYHELVAARPELNVHGVVLRDSVFNRESTIFDEHERLRLGDMGASRRRFRSQLVFFSGIGAPKLTNGIGTTVGAFKYTNNAHERFESIGGPAIAYGAGYCVSAAELMRNQLWFELREARARAEGRSTRQVLTRELTELDAMPKLTATSSTAL